MKGRVALIRGERQPFEIVDYPLVSVGDEQVLVRLTYAGVCGSDLHMWRGEMPWLNRFPTAPGHEMVGYVAQLGKKRTHDTTGQPLREGDRVVFSFFQPCGTCTPCLFGESGCERRNAPRGALSTDDPPHFHGAFGDYYYLEPRQWIYRVPDELDDQMIAPVNCALGTVIYGLQRAGMMLADRVLIQGAGGLGLYAASVARSMGASLVVVADRIESRLALARQFGADDTVNIDTLSGDAWREWARARTAGEGFDLVVEVTGSSAAVPAGVSALRAGGRYLVLGNIVTGATSAIAMDQVVRYPKVIVGSAVYAAWTLPRALRWLCSPAAQQFPLATLTGKVFPLEQVNEAFAEAEWSNRQGLVGRILVSLQP